MLIRIGTLTINAESIESVAPYHSDEALIVVMNSGREHQLYGEDAQTLKLFLNKISDNTSEQKDGIKWYFERFIARIDSVSEMLYNEDQVGDARVILEDIAGEIEDVKKHFKW